MRVSNFFYINTSDIIKYSDTYHKSTAFSCHERIPKTNHFKINECNPISMLTS